MRYRLAVRLNSNSSSTHTCRFPGDILRAGALQESRRYRMSERLVLPADLRRLAERTGLYEVEPAPAEAERAFPGSVLALLRRR